MIHTEKQLKDKVRNISRGDNVFAVEKNVKEIARKYKKREGEKYG